MHRCSVPPCFQASPSGNITIVLFFVYQVTLTAIDECGNVSTCTSTVTVEEGVYECDPELYKANADYLELIYCPGGTITGDIDLFANDEGFTRENSDFGVLTNLPEGVYYYRRNTGLY